MLDRKEEFYRNVIISDEDKVRAERYLLSKGVEKHIILKEKLLNWIEGNEIEYSLIASTYRYDKRIRNVLFKYISYLEEYYRAIILDAYRFSYNEVTWCKDIQSKLREYKDLNDALEHTDFSSLLYQIECLFKKGKIKIYFGNKKHLHINLIAVRELRNAVMHNKFLILYRGFEICYVDDVSKKQSGGLRANIINLMNFLPPEVAQKCKEEIVNSQHDNNDSTSSKWNLPKLVIVDLNRP